jgi:hypothetical protein
MGKTGSKVFTQTARRIHPSGRFACVVRAV